MGTVKELVRDRILSREGRDTWADAWGKAITKLMDMAMERLAGRVVDIKKDTSTRTMEAAVVRRKKYIKPFVLTILLTLLAVGSTGCTQVTK